MGFLFRSIPEKCDDNKLSKIGKNNNLEPFLALFSQKWTKENIFKKNLTFM